MGYGAYAPNKVEAADETSPFGVLIDKSRDCFRESDFGRDYDVKSIPQGRVKLITGLAGPARVREKGTASPYFIDILPRASILFYPTYPFYAVLLINSS